GGARMTRDPPSAWCQWWRSETANLRGLRALLPLCDLELDPLAVFQAAVAAADDLGEVHEYVGRAAVRCDEAEALLSIEPLDGSLSHVKLSLRMVNLMGTTPRGSRCVVQRTPRGGSDSQAGVHNGNC